MRGQCHCGAACWRFDTVPADATACNCTFCRRAGVLWIYGHQDETVHLTAPDGGLRAYCHGDRSLEFLSCVTCGNLVAWRSLTPGADGRRRMAVNLRLTEPGPVAHLPVAHFDGLDSWADLPADGRTVGDMWF